MSSRTVTVILPTYNRGRLLARSVDSILNQTYEDFTLLIIDDGSTDDTKSIVEHMADPRIQYVELSHNHGQAAARNIGIAMSQTDFTAFQDSDDTWVQNKLKMQMSAMDSNPDVGVVYGDLLRIFEQGEPRRIVAPDLKKGERFDSRSSMYATYGIGVQTCMFRTSVLKRHNGFEERLQSLEDLDLLLRINRNNLCIRIPEVLAHYHETESITSDRDKEYASRSFLLRRYALPMLLHRPHWVWKELKNIRIRQRLD